MSHHNRVTFMSDQQIWLNYKFRSNEKIIKIYESNEKTSLVIEPVAKDFISPCKCTSFGMRCDLSMHS